MKKIMLLFGLLWLPFLASAQWSVLMTAAAGVAAETSITPAYGSSEPLHFGYSTLDYSFQGGVEVSYFYTPRFGLGSGLIYSHSRSLMDFRANPDATEKKYWHSETIKIPLNLNWAFGKARRSIILFGLVGNINLRRHEFDPPDYSSVTYRNNPFFLGIQLGYHYKLGNRFQIGILLYRDINWFRKQIFQNSDGTIEPALTSERYFHTVQLTLSYRLFGNTVKGKN